ncbi:MAG: 16S rRNA (guanine(527)-N(7))-methyltransferase RsmG [Thermoguttaceae bacterium]
MESSIDPTTLTSTPSDFVSSDLHSDSIDAAIDAASSTPASSTLTEALAKFGISLTAAKTKKLDAYCQLLWDWNERLNLTRHTTYDKFVARDLVDSLALEGFLLKNERILDIGTGGGVPGVVLAILRPDLQVELCDSTGKKALAVSEMIQELRLDIPVYHAKAEVVLAERNKWTRFTTLTVRAVSRMTQLLRMVAPHWHIFDRMLLVKGPNWIAERGEARHYNLVNKLALRCMKTYPNPLEVDIESVILQLCRKDDFEKLDSIIAQHADQPDDQRAERFVHRRTYKTK